MKSIVTFILINLCLSFCGQAQDFDTELENLAKETAAKITAKGKSKIAIWGFFETNGNQSALGNYITEDFSVYITNQGDNFEVIDRNHLDLLLKEHRLNSEGFIDENTAKEIGKISAADAIITGTYSVLGKDKVKIRVKVLDTETALQFAASMGLLSLNEGLMDIANTSYDAGGTKTKGVSEGNQDCQDSKGTICFYNTKSEKMIVSIRYFKYLDPNRNTKNNKTLIIDVGETKCIYELYNREAEYFVATFESFNTDFKGAEHSLFSQSYVKFLDDKGQIMVEACKEKTFTIK